ncbi:MAG: ABC transporter ATP-binding protein, partial [Vallitaleaceae bacterium]|nr:ABC transporter ATP-binding protein [Vallitaleaceae bacterium]
HLAVMREIGYMSQEDALYQDLSGIDNLVFYSQLNGFSRKKSIEEAKKSLELVSLLPDKDKKVLYYSGGMKRRLSLAIALMNHPKLLVLDEPTVGIDPVLRQVFWQEFKRRKEAVTSILVTTHVMDEAEKCDKLAMIREGQIIAFDHPDKIKELSGKATLEEAFVHLSIGKAGNQHE